MTSLLSERAVLAHAALAECRLCPRDCGVDRRSTRQGAFCRLDETAWIYKELLSVGEEAALNPTWLVDVGGCSLRCLYCSEWPQVVRPQQGGAVPLDPQWFARKMAHRTAQGARTVTLVGGEPTVNLPALLTALAACDAPLPVVWNSNGLVTAQARALLQGLVAVWSLDAKFGNPQCAQRISGNAADIDHADWQQTTLLALSQAPQAGLPALVVRHLLMPGHLDCCTRPVLARLARIAATAPPGLMFVNLMSWFAAPVQPGLARVPELSAQLQPAEVAHAQTLARDLLGPRLWLDGRP